ncbi:PKD domain-containing protein [Calothrix sp. NIES-2100]|uniref:PKD domain-containing protein n=1 Tax=Calothrix sp. NIES-2100 TaxID=1954172 RepID=UPI0030D848DB
MEINPTEIPLPSSVPLQQLVNSYPHLYNSTLTNTYKDNPLNLFDPTFNINFQIADFPTGQLVEAQITQFDSLGRPNSGTILIVNNAAPTITNISGDTNINEGAVANFIATAADPGNDTITYTWDFGNGVTKTGENVSHVFADEGT